MPRDLRGPDLNLIWITLFVIMAATTTIGYFFLSTDLQSVLYDLIAIASALLIFAGILLRKPSPLYVWVCIACGVSLFAIGDVIYGTSQPGPSLSDVLYVGAYPLLGIGLVGFIRERHRSLVSPPVGPLIVGLEAGVLTMIVLLVITGGADTESFLTRAVSLGYPVMDAILLGLLLQTTHDEPRHLAAYRLLGAALTLHLIADTGYVLQDFGTDYVVGDYLDAAWLLAYWCSAASLLGGWTQSEGVGWAEPPAEPSDPRPDGALALPGRVRGVDQRFSTGSN